MRSEQKLNVFQVNLEVKTMKYLPELSCALHKSCIKFRFKVQNVLCGSLIKHVKAAETAEV